MKGESSRVLLKRLRDSLAEPGNGQARLDRIVKLIASSMQAEVCSIYLKKDPKTLELFATEGLNLSNGPYKFEGRIIKILILLVYISLTFSV